MGTSKEEIGNERTNLLNKIDFLKIKIKKYKKNSNQISITVFL